MSYSLRAGSGRNWAQSWSCSQQTHKETISISNTTLFQSRFHARLQNCEELLLSLSCLSYVRTSVCPHVTNWLKPDGFSWNLIFEDFSDVFRENSTTIENWEEYRVLYMKTYGRLWGHLAEFFLEWEIFQTKLMEKIKIQFLCSIFFPPENLAIYAKILKNIVESDRDNMGHVHCMQDDKRARSMHIACWIPTATNTHSEYVTLIVFIIIVFVPCT